MNPDASSSTPSDEGRDELEALAKDAELLPRSLYLTVTQVLYRSRGRGLEWGGARYWGLAYLEKGPARATKYFSGNGVAVASMCAVLH